MTKTYELETRVILTVDANDPVEARRKVHQLILDALREKGLVDVKEPQFTADVR